MKIVALGGLTLDWSIGPTGRAAGRVCGGNAAYCAAGARLWTDHVAIVSRVGCDYPQSYLDDIAAAGIDVSGVRRLNVPHELVAGYRYDRLGRRTDILDPAVFFAAGVSAGEAPGSNAVLRGDPWRADMRSIFDPSPEQLTRRHLRGAAVHLANMGPVAQLRLADHLAQLGIPFSIDATSPNMRSEDTVGVIARALAYLPSEIQVERLLNQRVSAVSTLSRLGRLGPRVVAVKLGREGSIVLDVPQRRQWRVPIYKTKVVDPTGAGDAWCGGFLATFIATGDPLESALHATVSASFVIEGFDARRSLDRTRSMALERVDVVSQLTNVDGAVLTE